VGGPYNVDWDNDGVVDETNLTGSRTHDYGVAGTYTIRISGTPDQIYFNNGGETAKILSVDQWGTIPWKSMNGAFFWCQNLVVNATDIPNLSSVTDMGRIFAFTKMNTNINNWDISNVVNMEGLFYGSLFNQPLDSWNTSNVMDMGSMFANTPFNQPLNSWNTSKVTNMSNMFSENTAFNQDISSWSTSNVTNMSGMFQLDAVFNQPIGIWDTSKVTDMTRMFKNCSNFNQDITTWDTSSVMYMGEMFSGASNFNQNISGWDTSKVLTMFYMFLNANSFNQNISSWDTGSVIDMSNMFYEAISFNQNIGGWNTGNVEWMGEMFSGASSFDQNLGSWSLASLEDAAGIFDNSGMSSKNYTRTLDGWSSQSLKSGIWLGADGIKACPGSARSTIISNFSWNISDAGDAILAVPDAPVITSVSIIGGGQANISFTIPEDNCSTITGYTITSNPGNISVSGSSSPLTIANLLNGTTYTFSTVAINSVGTSTPSTPSDSVTPRSSRRLILSTVTETATTTSTTTEEAAISTTTATIASTTAPITTTGGSVIATTIATTTETLGGSATTIVGTITGAGSIGTSSTYTSITPLAIASTTPANTTYEPVVANLYLNSYIKLGSNNDSEQVKKLQTFLNTYEGNQLVVDGIYKQVDESAVNAFQLKYKEDVLDYWELKKPTGYVYIKTQATINRIYSENINKLNCPYFTNPIEGKISENEVHKIRQFLLETQGEKISTSTPVQDKEMTEAIKRFQTKYADQILLPWKLKAATGEWYQTTRKMADQLLGCSYTYKLDNGEVLP